MASLLTNFSWKLGEKFITEIVAFIVSIIIARLLGPEAYGVVALVIVFISVSQIFVDGGFNSALIQKKNADDKDFSSVFYFSLGFSFLLYIFLFITAPYISDFYGSKYDDLTLVFRVLGVMIIIKAINAVQTAYVQKKMMFKNFFYANLVGSVISGIIGIVMAYIGFGIWALVCQQLSSIFINTFTLYYITRKRPILCFSIERLKSLLNFGSKVFASNLLIAIYKDLRSIVIGKIYSATDLALFNRGTHYPNLLVNNINTSLGAVLYPKMSLVQDDIEKIKYYLRKSLRMSSFVLVPALCCLATVAEPLIRVMLTDKWIDCVPYLQILCFVNMFQPLSNINNQAIRASGRSGFILRIELVKKTIELITLLMVMRISVIAIVVNMLVMSASLNFLFIRPNSKYFGYSFTQQMRDIAPGFVFGGIMMSIVYPINFIDITDSAKIVLEVICCFVLYVMMAKLSKNEEYMYIKDVIINRMLKK